MKRDMEDILLDLIDGDIDIDRAKEELLFLNSVSNGTSAKDIKMYRKQGRMSVSSKVEQIYKLNSEKFDDDYCDYDFTLLYDC